ncbi:uncharacterized protein LOC109721953 [Ananas comosus]|uniref:Uncharacterized protein LOC109721953 n=1 Tax=Ananas comosus TaxID=4615 RepID=A0A6P5GC37_ANACO|nr:uncharacterized protein LOC109721953 [Ananas comosus]
MNDFSQRCEWKLQGIYNLQGQEEPRSHGRLIPLSSTTFIRGLEVSSLFSASSPTAWELSPVERSLSQAPSRSISRKARDLGEVGNTNKIQTLLFSATLSNWEKVCFKN